MVSQLEGRSQVDSLSGLSYLPSYRGPDTQRAQEVLLKQLVSFQHFNLLVLTFRRESVRPESLAGACTAVSLMSSLTLRGQGSRRPQQAAEHTGRNAAEMLPGHLEESSPEPASISASACGSGRLPGLIFHCEKKCSRRNRVATWTGAPSPSQAQASLPSSDPPRPEAKAVSQHPASRGCGAAVCSANAAPTPEIRLGSCPPERWVLNSVDCSLLDCVSMCFLLLQRGAEGLWEARADTKDRPGSREVSLGAVRTQLGIEG